MLTNADRLALRRQRMESGVVVLRGGFRPFFLGSALWAIIALALWLSYVLGFAPGLDVTDPLAWHRHEMLFGFVGAAVAGFALTAVPNWTGQLPIAGAPLGMLTMIWFAGRILPLLVPDQTLVILAFDGGFYLLLAVLLGREIVRSKNRNLPIGIIIALFGVAASIDRLEMSGMLGAGSHGWHCGLALAIMLVSIIGGRIIPSFTRNWLAANGVSDPLPTQPGNFDKLVLVLSAAALLVWLLLQASQLAAWLLALCALGHLARLARWQGWRTFGNPLLAILHVGYAWLPIGFALLALAQHGRIAESAAIHAFSTGAMATLILAVMSRASLGHTGRALVAGWLMSLAYLLITLAAGARVLAGLAIGDQQAMLELAGIGWFGAFGLFLLRYIPVLCLPRADGKSGV